MRTFPSTNILQSSASPLLTDTFQTLSPGAAWPSEMKEVETKGLYEIANIGILSPGQLKWLHCANYDLFYL